MSIPPKGELWLIFGNESTNMEKSPHRWSGRNQNCCFFTRLL